MHYSLESVKKRLYTGRMSNLLTVCEEGNVKLVETYLKNGEMSTEFKWKERKKLSGLH